MEVQSELYEETDFSTVSISNGSKTILSHVCDIIIVILKVKMKSIEKFYLQM